MEQRIEWIDTAKGFAIFLVLFGHFCNFSQGTAIIYSFHMPLFFFLAGLVFNPSKYNNFKVFFIKKFKDLMIPCFIFNIVYLCWNFIHIYVLHAEGNLFKNMLGILIQQRNTDFSCGAWFITCMFCAEILLYLVFKLSKSNIYITTTLVILLFLLGCIYCTHVTHTLPWNIDASLIAIFFIYLGYCSKEYVSKIKPVHMLFFIPLFLISLLNFYSNSRQRVEMYANSYGNILLFLLAAFCGIIASIAFSKLIKLHILTFYGKHTLFLYGGQLVFASIFPLFTAKFHLYDFNFLIQLLIALCITSIVTLILTPLIKPYNLLIDKLKHLI